MNTFYILIIRIIIGAVVAVVICRLFWGEIRIGYVAGLAVIMIGLAYFAEYLRQRRR